MAVITITNQAEPMYDDNLNLGDFNATFMPCHYWHKGNIWMVPICIIPLELPFRCVCVNSESNRAEARYVTDVWMV